MESRVVFNQCNLNTGFTEGEMKVVASSSWHFVSRKKSDSNKEFLKPICQSLCFNTPPGGSLQGIYDLFEPDSLDRHCEESPLATATFHWHLKNEAVCPENQKKKKKHEEQIQKCPLAYCTPLRTWLYIYLTWQPKANQDVHFFSQKTTVGFRVLWCPFFFPPFLFFLGPDTSESQNFRACASQAKSASGFCFDFSSFFFFPGNLCTWAQIFSTSKG